MESHLGESAVWKPRLDSLLPEDKEKLGLTDYAGTTHLSRDAFEYPGKLAMVLLHEQEHFKDLITKDRDLRNDAAVEIRIRDAQRAIVAGVFKVNSRDLQHYDIARDGYADAVSEIDAKIAEGFDPYNKTQWQTVFHPILNKHLPLEADQHANHMVEGLTEIRRNADALNTAIGEEQRQRQRNQDVHDDMRRAQARQERSDRAGAIIHDWARKACSNDTWYESYDWSRVPAAYDDLVVAGIPIDFPLAYADRPEDACARFVEDRVLIRRAHDEATPDWPWIWWLVSNTIERARAAEDQSSRATLQGWADTACAGLYSWQSAYGLERLQRMYRGIIPSTWDGRRAVAMGDPQSCSYYVIDAMLAQKRHGGPEPDWYRFSDLAWIAFTEHRPLLLPPATAGPTPAPTPVTTPQPRPAPPSDPGDGRTDPQPPPIPHCRYHPWCRDNQ